MNIAYQHGSSEGLTDLILIHKALITLPEGQQANCSNAHAIKEPVPRFPGNMGGKQQAMSCNLLPEKWL